MNERSICTPNLFIHVHVIIAYMELCSFPKLFATLSCFISFFLSVFFFLSFLPSFLSLFHFFLSFFPSFFQWVNRGVNWICSSPPKEFSLSFFLSFSLSHYFLSFIFLNFFFFSLSLFCLFLTFNMTVSENLLIQFCYNRFLRIMFYLYVTVFSCHAPSLKTTCFGYQMGSMGE